VNFRLTKSAPALAIATMMVASTAPAIAAEKPLPAAEQPLKPERNPPGDIPDNQAVGVLFCVAAIAMHV
jgi:hypothetical protein